jgi:hypothetical protein
LIFFGWLKFTLWKNLLIWIPSKMKPSKRTKFLAKEKVKGLFEQFSPQATAGHNSGPPQQTYFCGSGLLMDYPRE